MGTAFLQCRQKVGFGTFSIKAVFVKRQWSYFSWKAKMYSIINALSKQSRVNIDSVSLYIFLIN